MNGCLTEITFSCGCYTQPECDYFEQNKNVPTTCCKYGLYERPCIQIEANNNSLSNEIERYNGREM